jgi:glutathione S-transferase
MMTFYTNPFSRGRVARWMLEEVGEPYDDVILGFGPGMRTPEYLSINPMAKVPALVHDGSTITEVAAILAYLADRFPAAGLLPADRGAFFRWMFFGAGPVEYALINASFGFEVPPEAQGRMGYGSLDRVTGTLRAQVAFPSLPVRRRLLGRRPLPVRPGRLRPGARRPAPRRRARRLGRAVPRPARGGAGSGAGRRAGE